ncbi:LysR family transcriptional regulator [Ensifer sp. ENS07]|uniref:LysR family transcriptional regulator n=1 Tax=Ensifer sp. ENS07 TaxID=2769274 RepID=UPI00178281DC|nr:LysR family transcriptional regulator [Ensifer sp. ENS07]MBD9641745.1 LysR family transcriptional regulator [Ensifer sp. ENS07]
MSKLGQLQDIDLRLLRCFCTIVEEGSFTAAQVALNLSQPSLSEYLKTLELRLGVKLCQRGPKGFKLFDEGRVVYLAARDLFASIEGFKDSVNTLGDGYRGELVMAVEDSIVDNPECRLPLAIKRFSEITEGVKIRVEIMLGAQVIGRVADGLIPLGIGLYNPSFSQLEYTALFSECLELYCSSAHRLFDVPDGQITAAQIASYPYCSRGHLEATHPDRVDTSPFAGDIGLGAHAQLALILSGRNLGYLPAHTAESYVKSKQLRSVKPDLVRRIRSVAAMRTPRSAQNKLVKNFLRTLVDVHAPLSVR